MKLVLCAYAENQARGVEGLRRETRVALERRCPHPVEFVDVGWDDTAYWRALREAWTQCSLHGDDLIVVEHDVVPRAGCFERLDACPQPWCGYAYELAGGTQMALGFTRFRAELIQAQPLALELAGLICDDGMPPRHWVRLDTRIDRVLREAGLQPHEHYPPVRHFNDRQREVRVA